MRFLLVALFASSAFAAPCTLVGKPWLTAKNPDALAGETVEIRLNARVKLNGKITNDWSRCDNADVRWRRIEPEMEHVDTPSPNKSISVYANAVVFGPDHGSWIGYDKIEYFSTELEDHGPILQVKDAHPSDDDLADKRAPELRGLGVMRVAATLFGKSTAPLRYTYRSGNDFLGWLSSFYNVPYLFGSAGKGKKNQAEQYIGADCADILVAALRKAGWTKMEYSSVADLVDSLHPVGKPVEIQPGQRSQLRWGHDVKPGDLLALDYVGADSDLPRDWDHIVAAISDDGDGVLGPEDLVADSGDSEGLKQARLGEQGHVRVAVLRPPPHR